MTEPRSLDESDIGKVFLRVDGVGKPGEYLYLTSVGDIASFVTFRDGGDGPAEVGETGYVNGEFFEEVSGFSEAYLAEVERRDRAIVEERLRSLREEAEAIGSRNDRLRARCAKPDSWTVVDDGATDAGNSYVVWHDAGAARYVVEVHGPDDAVLASATTECSHEPRFGMDVVDHERIFGADGVLACLIAELES